MTLAQVEAGMARVIRARLDVGQPIALDAFRLADLPVREIEPRFKRVLATVQNQMAMER